MSGMQAQYAQRSAPYQPYGSSYGGGAPSFDRRAPPPGGNFPPPWGGGVESGGGGYGGQGYDDDMKPPSPTPTLSGIKRLTAKVRPMLEANGVFEVSLIGNSMLPMSKRSQEVVTLAQKLPPQEAGTLPQEVARFAGHPDMLARALEAFINRGLSTDLQQRNDAFKTFLGLHLAVDTDHFRANVDGTVTRGRPPLRPQNVQEVEAMDLASASAAQQAEIARRDADAASADEKAAALELIRQRRATKISAKQPERPAPEPARPVEAPPQPSFSSASYSAALSATDKLISSYTNEAPKPPAPAAKTSPAPVPGAKRALKQAEAIMEQVDFKTELRTWISSQDKDGYTFTQSISGDMMDVDIVPMMSSTIDSARGPKSSEGRTASAGAAPAPMEASGSSTASRVAAIAGHTNSFRDIKRKFAGNANVTDQEYESSLSNLPSAAPFSDQNKAVGTAEDRGGNEEGAFKPNQGVIQALIKVMRTCGEQTDVVKAATALCNLSCDSAQNREIAFKEGAVAVLCDLLSLESSVGQHGGRVHEVAAACLSNLAGFPPAKKAIAEASGLSLLQQVLCGTNLSAASQAAGALWALCIDGDDIKENIATPAAVRTLIRLLDTDVATRAGFSHTQRTELQARAAGCISEVCIRNPIVKSKIGSAGAIPELLRVCKGDDITCQRLAAQGLCNLVANHGGNKRLAKKNKLVREMADVLKATQVIEIQAACASVIFNIVCKSDKEELEGLEILSQLRSIKNSRNIDVRLMCVTNSVGEAQSPAFGTF